MANRLKGITLEIGGDTKDLSNALKGVNKEIKDTQSSLKDTEKLLKLDPKNTELLRQKQKLLGDAVSETNKKLEELKKAQATMDAAGVDKSSQEYMALQREIISTENELKNLEKAADKSDAAMAAIGATADKIASGASKVADATRGLSTAAAGVLTALAGAGYSAITTADDLNTLAKQTGFSTDELQKFQIASELVDVSVSDITGAAKKLKSAMSSGSDAFQKIGVSVTDARGAMRDINDVFYDVLTGLSGVKNETERDQLAMEIFGKSADSLAGIIDDGGKALQEYGDAAERAGLIMSGETLNSLNEVNDAVSMLKAEAKATLQESGAKAIEALLPVLEKVVAIIDQILMWVGSLNTEQIQTVAIIAAIVAAISPIAGTIASISSAISGLMPVISMVKAAIIADPFLLVIAAIGAAVIALGVLIIDNWDAIQAAFEQMGESIKSAAKSIAEAIKSAFQYAWAAVKAVFNAILNLGRSIANGIISLVENAVNGVISKLNSLINMINSVASALASLVGISYSGIGNIGKVNIPKFAKGGTLTSGTALVGEAGPELLTVSGGRATVTPLTASLDSNSLAALNNGSGNTTTTVNVQFTGSLSQLAAVLQPAITAETTRRGVALVK